METRFFTVRWENRVAVKNLKYFWENGLKGAKGTGRGSNFLSNTLYVVKKYPSPHPNYFDHDVHEFLLLELRQFGKILIHNATFWNFAPNAGHSISNKPLTFIFKCIFYLKWPR